MEFQDLKTKSAAELDRRIAEFRMELQDLRRKAAAGQLTHVRKIRAMRKTIAQALMLRTQAK